MLVEYNFNNFCSFNSDNEFNLVAPGGKIMKRFPDNYIETNSSCEIFKTAVIVGENAGGKSNFINSLKFLKTMFANNERVGSIHAYINSGSLKENSMPAQKFELTVIADNNIIYNYEIWIDADGILAEYLSSQKKKKSIKQDIMRAHRGAGKEKYFVELYNDTQEVNKAMQKTSPSIGLFVTKLALLGNEDAIAFVNWMNGKLFPESVYLETNSDIKKAQEDMRILRDSRYVNIFRMVDYSICNIEIDEEKPYSKTRVIRKNKNGEILSRELQTDSTGVREFFAWAVQIFRVVYENKVVFADEMDRVLNPILSDRVIAFINGNTHNGQFIFSTHNVLHLDLKTYMKEQIYFITKNKEKLTSELYSLSDFPEVRYETTKIYEFYMKGILGGTAYE